MLNTRLHSIQSKTHREVLIRDTTTTTSISTTMPHAAHGRQPPTPERRFVLGETRGSLDESLARKNEEDFPPPASNLERAKKSKADSVFDCKYIRIQTRIWRFLYFVTVQSACKVEHWLGNYWNWLKTFASVQLVFAFVLVSPQQEPLRRSFITLFSGKQRQQHGSSSSEQTVPV